MDTLPVSSDRNLIKQLLFIERDIGDDVGTSPLAFTLPPRKGDLADASAR